MFMNKIVDLVCDCGIQLPWRDMYSNHLTKRFEDHIVCAEEADWQLQDRVMWLNPPYSIWEAVSQRLLESTKGTFVALVPDWGQPWIAGLLSITRKKWYIAAGTPLFELDQVRCGPTRWGVWLLLITAARHPVDAFGNVTILPWNQALKSRAHRRGKVEDQKSQLPEVVDSAM
jgi:hypothetical protein